MTKEAPPDLDLRFGYFDVPKPLRWHARGPLHLHPRCGVAGGRLCQRLHQRALDCVHPSPSRASRQLHGQARHPVHGSGWRRRARAVEVAARHSLHGLLDAARGVPI
jgi:hypothetical protein